jgi:hypothetical protein
MFPPGAVNGCLVKIKGHRAAMTLVALRKEQCAVPAFITPGRRPALLSRVWRGSRLIIRVYLCSSVVSAFVHFGATGKFFASWRLCVKTVSRGPCISRLINPRNPPFNSWFQPSAFSLQPSLSCPVFLRTVQKPDKNPPLTGECRGPTGLSR